MCTTVDTVGGSALPSCRGRAEHSDCVGAVGTTAEWGQWGCSDAYGSDGEAQVCVWDECRGDETDGWYQRDCGYCYIWVGSEGVQMWKMSVDISWRDDISIFPQCPLKCAAERNPLQFGLFKLMYLIWRFGKCLTYSNSRLFTFSCTHTRTSFWVLSCSTATVWGVSVQLVYEMLYRNIILTTIKAGMHFTWWIVWLNQVSSQWVDLSSGMKLTAGLENIIQISKALHSTMLRASIDYVK